MKETAAAGITLFMLAMVVGLFRALRPRGKRAE